MTDRNIVDLAHRVLGADKVGRDLNNAAAWDAVDLVLENAPALARAVIDLTAKVKRMEALEAALEKVLELHQPVTDGMGFTEHGYGGISPACGACGTSDEYAVPYPCPTVEAITAALEAIK